MAIPDATPSDVRTRHRYATASTPRNFFDRESGIDFAEAPSMVTVVRKYESKYDLAVERITITIDKRTLAAIKRVAGPRGVSAFVTKCAKERLANLDLISLLDEYDKKYGKPNPRLVREIDRDMRKIFGIKK